MLTRRLATALPPTRVVRTPPIVAFTQRRNAYYVRRVRTYLEWVMENPEERDPGMNGGYKNPPATLRQFRDPYADWWDKQERRNFGEPVHEDNDILGMFSPHEYTHFTPGWGAICLGSFVVTFLGVVAVARMVTPDMPSVKRGYEGGLDRELGGEGALLVSENSLRNGKCIC